MKVVITGGGGFLGSRLARALAARGELGGRTISKLTLVDAAFPAGLSGFRMVKGDIADPATLREAIETETEAVFHLAAVVSGAAEADFDLGMHVNLDGTRLLLERLRQCARPPRLVFASSVAAFGGELPAVLDDSTTPLPQTSYGTQKVIGEYLVSDYSRKDHIDGRSLRLPTIVVRAGAPNAAASSFASGIIREPLNRSVSECPVAPETGVWLLSPRRVVDAFVHAHELAPEAWGAKRVVNLPGITATVAGNARGLAARRGRQGGRTRRMEARRAHPGDREDLAGALPDAARAGNGFQAGSRRGFGDPRLHRRRENQALATSPDPRSATTARPSCPRPA
jgi:D-erythronate 2-dehydrogenase